MSKHRLEAFSDGVIAILITIMVLELKVPHGVDVAALGPLWPVFLSYLLSFVYVGIYWSNHHHMFHAVQHVNGAVLWANLHFLFWLSLVPFTTGWMGENHFAAFPTAVYGFVLLMAGIAYLIMEMAIIRDQGSEGGFVRHLQLEHHDRDQDRDHPVTEGQQPVLLHPHPPAASSRFAP